MKQLIKKITPQFIQKGIRNYKKQKHIKPYAGDKVLCSICNSKFSRFAPYGLAVRENAKCPSCGSLERHRLLWKYITEKTNLVSNKEKIRLLHFAPEKSFYEIFSANQYIEYIPCDLSPKRYIYDGNVKIRKVDITSIPFEDNSFDVILCNHVLEHIPDDSLAMRELYRVMKKGGWGIFQVPLDYDRTVTYEDFTISTPKAREKAYGQFDHVRLYGQDYKNRLGKAGFDVKEDDYVKSFSAEELFKFGFMDFELIYYCKK